MEVGIEVGEYGIGVDVYVGLCVGVWVGGRVTRAKVEGSALGTIETEGVGMGGKVVWIYSSDDILTGVQAAKTIPETITKRFRRDFIMPLKQSSFLDSGNGYPAL